MAETMPQPNEYAVSLLMNTAGLREDYVLLHGRAPVDVFEAARRLGYHGRLRVVPGSDFVRVERTAEVGA